MNDTLKQAQENLEELFRIFNDHFYSGELETPIISIQQDPRNSSYGWCTTYKAWSTTDNQEFYEINICAEYLNRDLSGISGTLLHEMAHLYNISHDIKDCNGKRHNIKFKKTAEEHGLIIEKNRYGWSETSLNPETQEFIKNMEYSFNISRRPKPKKARKAKKPTYKYICPCCGAKVTSKMVLNIQCMDCEYIMEMA